MSFEYSNCLIPIPKGVELPLIVAPEWFFGSEKPIEKSHEVAMSRIKRQITQPTGDSKKRRRTVTRSSTETKPYRRSSARNAAKLLRYQEKTDEISLKDFTKQLSSEDTRLLRKVALQVLSKQVETFGDTPLPAKNVAWIQLQKSLNVSAKVLREQALGILDSGGIYGKKRKTGEWSDVELNCLDLERVDLVKILGKKQVLSKALYPLSFLLKRGLAECVEKAHERFQ